MCKVLRNDKMWFRLKVIYNKVFESHHLIKSVNIKCVLIASKANGEQNEIKTELIKTI